MISQNEYQSKSNIIGTYLVFIKLNENIKSKSYNIILHILDHYNDYTIRTNIPIYKI